jgi:hypothetical protein
VRKHRLDSWRRRQRDDRGPHSILDIVDCATGQLGNVRYQPTRKKELAMRDVVFPELIGEQPGKPRDTCAEMWNRRENARLEIEPVFLKHRVANIEKDG